MPSKLFGIDLRLPSPPIDRSNIKKNLSSGASSPVTQQNAGMDHIKRPSLAGLAKKGSDKKDRSLSKDKNRSSSKDKNAKGPSSPVISYPVKLSMVIESPPVLFHGPPSQSTGALISGRLQVIPNAADATLDTIAMYLEATASTKKPVSDRCRECMTQVNDLFEWKFLTKPKTFKAQDGMQELPFSHLVPGNLPATTHGAVGSIDYSLHVRAKSSDGRETEFRRDLFIHRALLPGPEKHSMRVFPPTNMTLHVTLPSTIHPIGDFLVQCRMTGITVKRDDSQSRWRLRKLTWRVEELETSISPACKKHAEKVGGEGKGVQHEHTREVGVSELRSGWKTDFDKGEIEGEFPAKMDPSSKPQTDMDAQSGLKISHNLILELVIAEEWAPNKKPHQATPTGAARVLRTQFALNVTDRAGMGISWDEEMPPNYDNVPASPPHYVNEFTTMHDYEGDDLHEDVEHLNLGS